jgi:hypothetical protein
MSKSTIATCCGVTRISVLLAMAMIELGQIEDLGSL